MRRAADLDGILMAACHVEPSKHKTLLWARFGSKFCQYNLSISTKLSLLEQRKKLVEILVLPTTPSNSNISYGRVAVRPTRHLYSGALFLNAVAVTRSAHYDWVHAYLRPRKASLGIQPLEISLEVNSGSLRRWALKQLLQIGFFANVI